MGSYRDACGMGRTATPGLAKRWTKWELGLPERITFARALVRYHVFGDASGQGVAAAAYRVVSQPSGFAQGIVAAKGHLAKQGLTIPHLELVVSHMTTNLATNPVDGVLLLVREHSGTPVDKGIRTI